MNYQEFKEKLLKPQPAFIKGAIDQNGDILIEANGRGGDVMALMMSLTEKVLESTPMSVEEYCHILKKGVKESESKRHESTFIKMYKDLFNE